jgi:hypothetical protein
VDCERVEGAVVTSSPLGCLTNGLLGLPFSSSLRRTGHPRRRRAILTAALSATDTSAAS